MAAAIAVYVLCLGLTLVGGSLVGGSLGGITALEWVALALPVWVTARAAGRPSGRSAGEVLGVKIVHGRALAGATLVGISAWLVLVNLVLPLQEKVAPMPPELVRALEAVATPDAPLALTLAALALTPAICEELLCRGLLLGALLPRVGRAGAVLIAAALFAALHLSPYRFVPTFVLGVFFGAMTIGSGSVVPAMIAHALNNGAIVLMGHPAGAALRDALDARPAAATAGGVLVLTIGLALAVPKR